MVKVGAQETPPQPERRGYACTGQRTEVSGVNQWEEELMLCPPSSW